MLFWKRFPQSWVFNTLILGAHLRVILKLEFDTFDFTSVISHEHDHLFYMHDRTIFIFTIRTKPTENVVNFSRNEHSLDKPKTLVSTRLKVNPGRILCGRFEISLKLEGKNHTSTCKTYMTYKNTSISRFKMGLKCICIYDRKWNFNLCIRTSKHRSKKHFLCLRSPYINL